MSKINKGVPQPARAQTAQTTQVQHLKAQLNAANAKVQQAQAQLDAAKSQVQPLKTQLNVKPSNCRLS